ncbi:MULTISPECIES: chemotaxis protein CheA [unclassified Halanaerobium]|uniref:chemotaxis protein CheA n=1 Tax=unclassified Halanaerobium TaxID=2641197 RepID=UPI000DF23A34|nr:MULTISPECIES: chemotaxis protein CheA [unclassified Halanaerobium]RCW47706.1 two-component system chemotaxis sensor kinase CheA [Halanaerobium sp. MA284_MarDTE_T2]RCW84650.1 two-component system chemotaxis sensor kinase CheA [Halanaerobium sp. DL-01]
MQDNNYLDLFFDETKEYIEILNNGILTLENNPDDKETVDAVFRAAHSLKGMAATMGFENLTELTHKMENMLDRVRDGELSVTTGFIDLLLQGLDNIQFLVEKIRENEGEEPADIDMEGFIEEISNFTSDQKNIRKEDNSESVSAGLTAEEKRDLLKKKKEKERVYHLSVEVDDADFISVRAFMVIKKVEEMGTLFKSDPSRDEIENSQFEGNKLDIYFLSWLPSDEIKVEIKDISNIKILNFNELESSELESDQEEKKESLHAEHKVNSFQSSSTVRVDISKLDTLMNMVGELLINKTRLQSLDIESGKFKEIIPQLDRVTMELHHIVMQIRMVPVGVMFSRFPRMIRDLSQKMGKEINFIMEGQETELDRSIIDELSDPLTHLLRNAIDHGIETSEERKQKGKAEEGKIELKAYQKGSEIMIEVKDDGAGIDADKIGEKAVERGIVSEEELEQMEKRDILDFIFHPGFSTAEEVTDVSGRGVGMDIVRNVVKKLDGQISIDSQLGKGSSFVISLPLTLAITQALMVNITDDIFAIPLNSVSETLIISEENIKKVRGKDVIVLRDNTIPLVSADKILGNENSSYVSDSRDLSVVILKSGDRRIGLIVDELLNQQEIVIKSLGSYLQDTEYISGATIIGDGDVALIIDVRDIVA